ncbi:hypothetical protein [Geobacter sp. AOG2]|uniref:hypothetical protein n=1 Tax=Geobacter sp. AOG2 TaxID=1566347 RepID=UPI001CC5B185|nr:hypothetical protein [Geobacter sp. AOG2]GFE61290.1 membrane protein [Geobacter sp. AOG2]
MNNNFSYHINKLRIGRPYQICLLCFIVLVIYYPTISAEISLLDDQDAISGLLNIETFNLKSIFFPGVKQGGYYRPFIGLSYIVDRFWWFLDARMMHFENIMMHLFNTVLVFLIGVKLYQGKSANTMMLPFLAAVLFALHPINTESVNWISGRTDAMACMFILTSLFMLILYRDNGDRRLLVGAYIITLLGILAKETALGFIPGSVCILLSLPQTIQKGGESVPNNGRLQGLTLFFCYVAAALLSALFLDNFYLIIVIGVAYWVHSLVLLRNTEKVQNISTRMRSLLIVAASCVLLVVVYQGLRKAAFVSDISKIPDTVKVMTADMNYTIELFMGAAGFYVKKFLIPLPLNIAIREVDPLYELFGVVCFFGCIYLISLRRIESALIIAGFFMLAPVFPLSFGTIAWTGYAERYDYMPSAFWILGGLGLINSMANDFWRRGILITALIILPFFAAITLQRNFIWQSNEATFKDAVEKSPEFKNVRGLYISALVDKKQYEEAEKQYFIAKKLYSLKYDERYDLTYASLLILKKKFNEAEKVYREVEAKTKGKSASLYESEINFYNTRENEELDAQKKREYAQNKIDAYENLYKINKSANTSYRLGLAYLSIGERDKAIKAIRVSVEQLEHNDPLKRNAEKLLESLLKPKQ